MYAGRWLLQLGFPVFSNAGLSIRWLSSIIAVSDEARMEDMYS